MDEANEYMLTTYDNPFNPFEDFIIWWKEDLRLGHDCCGLLASVANISDIASQSVNDEDIERAIDEIVKKEPMIYKKTFKSDYSKKKS